MCRSNMFSDKNARDFPDDSASFKSSWRAKRSVVNGSCQTQTTDYATASCQSLCLSEAGTQTKNKSDQQRKANLSPDELSKALQSADLGRFLQKAVPLITSEIERAMLSTAFSGFRYSNEYLHYSICPTRKGA